MEKERYQKVQMVDNRPQNIKFKNQKTPHRAMIESIKFIRLE